MPICAAIRVCAFMLTMQLCGVCLIELCYYNNSATIQWTSQYIATLLFPHYSVVLSHAIKTVENKGSIKQHTNNSLKVIFIIVESRLSAW